MVHPRRAWSGVVGSPGRRAWTEDAPALRSAQLRIGGHVLPLVSPARVYVCGITPYDVTHLGHAATFVWADAAAAVMRMAGVEVITCRNVTDVDDVLTIAAGSRGRSYDEFALTQEFLFEQDMTALGVRRPAHEPRARHHIPQVLHLAAALLATGHAYENAGHVYFRATGIAERAGLSDADAIRRGAAYGDDPEDPLRDHPLDVPIWRPSTEEHPAWPSPWGWGRPGWHAECAAMALAVFGGRVDLLAGGADLTFPHHAYQCAMVEAATSSGPFARAQMHVGSVLQGGTKMAKSTGNLVLVADLLAAHSWAALRLFLLDRPWAQAWDFRRKDLETAGGRLEQLYAAAGRTGSSAAASVAVSTALLDDLDVTGALDIAITEGGDAARTLQRVLHLV